MLVEGLINELQSVLAAAEPLDKERLTGEGAQLGASMTVHSPDGEQRSTCLFARRGGPAPRTAVGGVANRTRRAERQTW